MSNPYGGGYSSYEPPNEPTPYASPNPYGAPNRSTDGISIAALVCSLTCCAAPVGIGLGIAGLVRTSGGKRGGRWAAVTGVAVGAIGLVAIAAALVGLFWLGSNVVFEDEARVGQCVDVGESLGSTDLWQAECDEAHDAEVIAVGDFDSDLIRLHDALSTAEFCAEVATETSSSDLARSSTYDVGISTDSLDEDDPGSGDAFVCFVERADGEKLQGRL